MAKKVLVLIHSTYGHIKQLADAEVEGLKSTGAEVKLMQVPETLSAEILAKMHAQKFDLPVATPADLEWADGIIIGLSTRYGNASAQMKAFWDSTGQLWAAGKLQGKFGAIFQATGTQGGGQESAAISFLSNFVHHGIIFVPLGFADGGMGNHNELRGGTFWGAGCIAGADGSRQPSAFEKQLAKTQGTNFGKLLARVN